MIDGTSKNSVMNCQSAIPPSNMPSDIAFSGDEKYFAQREPDRLIDGMLSLTGAVVVFILQCPLKRLEGCEGGLCIDRIPGC